MSMSETPASTGGLGALRNLIANDGYAMSFQSMGQYRSALLRHFDALVDEPCADFAARAGKCPALRAQAAVITLDGDQQDSAQVATLSKPGDA